MCVQSSESKREQPRSQQSSWSSQRSDSSSDRSRSSSRDEPRKQQSSWNSQGSGSFSDRSRSSSRSQSSSPHEERLSQQKRIELARAAKPTGGRNDTSYYNSNKSSFNNSSQVIAQCLPVPREICMFDYLKR